MIALPIARRGFSRLRLGAALLLTALLAGSAAAQGTGPDLILYDGKIVTVDAQFSVAQALAIRDGKIIAVGRNADILALAPAARKIDLKGKTVTPGFVDAHSHLVQVGSSLYAQADLSGAMSIAAIKEKIAAQVKKTPRGGWVMVSSLGDPPALASLPGAFAEKRWPTRQDLDSVAPDNPVIIPTPWGGPLPAILNSSALLRLGITKQTPASDQGIIIEKDAQAEPTGRIWKLHPYYFGPYVAKLMGMMPRTSLDVQTRGVAERIRGANATGLTAINETHFITPDNIDVLAKLRDAHRLNMRVNLAYEIPGANYRPMDTIGTWMKAVAARLGSDRPDNTAASPGSSGLDWVKPDDHLRIDGISLSLDGPVSFGAAVLRIDYRDMNGDKAEQKLPLDKERIAQVAAMAAQNNLRLYFVIGGDRMADIVLDALEDVNRQTPLAGRNWVLNHVPFADQTMVARVKKIGLMVTAYSSSDYERNHADNLRIYGAENAKHYEEMSTPYGWWEDAGIAVAIGTDSAANPLFGIWHALARRNISGQSVMTPGKQVTRRQALEMYTINGARVMGWGDRIGSIENGKFADLVVLDTDLLTCPVDRIRTLAPAATLIGGRLVYGRLS